MDDLSDEKKCALKVCGASLNKKLENLVMNGASTTIYMGFI